MCVCIYTPNYICNFRGFIPPPFRPQTTPPRRPQTQFKIAEPVWVPALPLPSSMILGKSLHISELHSREPWSGDEELSLRVILTLGNNNFDQIFKDLNQLSSMEGLPSKITWRNEEGIRNIWPGKETPQSHVGSLKGVESIFTWIKK